MRTDPELIERVIDVFGKDVYDEEGELNKKALAQKVFGNPVELQKLNEIVHPAVFEDFEKWLKEHQNTKYTIKEAALLFESGAYKQLDKIITVSASKALRVARIMLRDNSSQTEIEARMSQQMSEEEKIKRADFVIENDGKKQLLPQVIQLHHKFISLPG
jgi:dephospho-CoA kinase